MNFGRQVQSPALGVHHVTWNGSRRGYVGPGRRALSVSNHWSVMGHLFADWEVRLYVYKNGAEETNGF